MEWAFPRRMLPAPWLIRTGMCSQQWLFAHKGRMQVHFHPLARASLAIVPARAERIISTPAACNHPPLSIIPRGCISAARPYESLLCPEHAGTRPQAQWLPDIRSARQACTPMLHAIGAVAVRQRCPAPILRETEHMGAPAAHTHGCTCRRRRRAVLCSFCCM